MSGVSSIEMTDIRYLIPSKDRKYIRNNVRHLKSGELLVIDPENDKYGGLANISISTYIVVGIAIVACAYVGYELYRKQ